MLLRNFILTSFIALGLFAWAPAVHAEDQQDAPATTADQPAAADDAAPAADKEAATDEEGDKEVAALRAAIVHGPAKVPLGDQAVVDMPGDYVFLPKEQALKIMEESGNHVNEDGFYGMFLPVDRDKDKWLVVAKFVDVGFVKDDDQNNINPDDILSSLKKGTAASNEDRKARGIPELEIVGWIEKPHYDAKTHRLVWSVEGHDIGAPANDDNSVNYNTLALGRGGYISLNLVSTRSAVETDKKAVGTLLSALSFDEGKKYEDFNPKTDKIAEYGLIALIGGLAAKKLGLFALLGVAVAKGAKVLVVAALAGVAALKKFFKRRDPTV
jgi:uncharacterized membrane-anchored protein